MRFYSEDCLGLCRERRIRPRRTGRLSRDKLVADVMIRYPLCMYTQTRERSHAEDYFAEQVERAKDLPLPMIVSKGKAMKLWSALRRTRG